MAARVRKKPSGYLLMLQQGSGETFKDFVARFNSKRMTIEDPADDMVYATRYQGLSPEEPLMKKLAKKQLSTLQGVMDKVEEFINQEGALKAMASSRPSREESPKRKKKKKKSS